MYYIWYENQKDIISSHSPFIQWHPQIWYAGACTNLNGFYYVHCTVYIVHCTGCIVKSYLYSIFICVEGMSAWRSCCWDSRISVDRSGHLAAMLTTSGTSSSSASTQLRAIHTSVMIIFRVVHTYGKMILESHTCLK